LICVDEWSTGGIIQLEINQFLPPEEIERIENTMISQQWIVGREKILRKDYWQISAKKKRDESKRGDGTVDLFSEIFGT
jgi:hypothetical protein